MDLFLKGPACSGTDHMTPESRTVHFSYVAPFLGAVLRIFSDSVKDSICNLIRGFGFSLKLDVVGTVTRFVPATDTTCE